MQIVTPNAEEVLELTAGRQPVKSIDAYVRAGLEKRLKGNANMLNSLDDAEWLSVYKANTAPASTGDPTLTQAAQEQFTQWGMVEAKDVVAIFRYRGVLSCANLSGPIPRVLLDVNRMNTAGQSPDFSDNELATYQEQLARIGIQPVPVIPSLSQFNLQPFIESGQLARREGRFWDGELRNANNLFGSLVYPNILEPIGEPPAGEEGPSSSTGELKSKQPSIDHRVTALEQRMTDVES